MSLEESLDVQEASDESDDSDDGDDSLDESPVDVELAFELQEVSDDTVGSEIIELSEEELELLVEKLDSIELDESLLDVEFSLELEDDTADSEIVEPSEDELESLVGEEELSDEISDDEWEGSVVGSLVSLHIEELS